jgi:glutamine synthetase type III
MFGSGVLTTDFAARKFLVFHDVVPIFILKRDAFGIVMVIPKIFLSIMHMASIMT